MAEKESSLASNPPGPMNEVGTRNPYCKWASHKRPIGSQARVALMYSTNGTRDSLLGGLPTKTAGHCNGYFENSEGLFRGYVRISATWTGSYRPLAELGYVSQTIEKGQMSRRRAMPLVE